MADRVFVDGLEFYCVLGVHEREREVARRVHIDLEIEVDCAAAGRSDAFADALDYEAVAEAVQRTVERSSFRLVEALAEAVAEAVLSGFPRAASVRVRLAKPGALPSAGTVGVVLERHRAGRAT